MDNYTETRKDNHLEQARKNSLKTAEELLYSENVKELIRNAKTESEMIRILIDARHGDIE